MNQMGGVLLDESASELKRLAQMQVPILKLIIVIALLSLPNMPYSTTEDKLDTQESSASCLPKNTPTAANYHLIRKFQVGGQATVYMASRGNSLFAIKTYGTGEREVYAFRNEVQLMGRLEWKGIVPIVEALEGSRMQWDQPEQVEGHLIVMPFYEHGDLLEYVSTRGPLSEETGRYFAKNMLSTLRYLEDKHVQHRDLKPENILFGENYQPLLLDFGLAVDTRTHVNSYVGDHRYAAPEVLKHVECTFKSEIFSLGVVFYFMLTGSLPFAHAKVSDPQYRLLLEQKYPAFWSKTDKKSSKILSPSFKKLFIAMTTPNPSKRPTIEQLLQMEWLQQATPNQQNYRLLMSGATE